MTRYMFSYKSLLIGVSLLGLLALGIALSIQMPLLPGATGLELSSDASGAIVEPAVRVHPADQKFFFNNYAGDGTAGTYLSAGVHPADRKFFADAHEAAVDIQLAAETADRKLQTPGYLGILMEQAQPDPLAGVHPADRTFFTNEYR